MKGVKKGEKYLFSFDKRYFFLFCMKKQHKALKPVILALVALVFLFSFVNVLGHVDVVYAANDDSLDKNTTITNSFVLKDYGEFKVKESDPKYYYIDGINEKDAKKALNNEENLLDKIIGFLDVSDNLKEMGYGILNWIVNICFTFNRFMTFVMITCLEFAFNFNIVDKLINKLNDKISGITGISNLNIHEGVGLFGGLIGIIVAIVAVYVLYIYLVKRAFISSASALLKSILAITISILLFSNYSYFLSTVNGLSNEVADHVLNAGTGSGLEKSGVDSAKDTLWKMFVDTPYMYLQYGTTDYNQLAGGKSRVMKLMQYPDGDDRYNYVVQTEIGKYRNTLMVVNTSEDKFAFTLLYLVTNGILSIPIFGLAFALILLNFWFLTIAAVAPFALLVGIIPFFNGVFKRYFIELMIPLGLKVFFTFFTLFILMVSDFLYEINYKQATANNVGEFIITSILQIVLLATLFILRNRIKDIFSSGSKIISGLRDSAGLLNSPAKSAVQTAATAVGAGVGAYVGGVHGAAVGANVGSTIGKSATGDIEAHDFLKTANALSNYFSKGKQSKNGQQLQNFAQVQSTQSQNSSSSKSQHSQSENVQTLSGHSLYDDETMRHGTNAQDEVNPNVEPSLDSNYYGDMDEYEPYQTVVDGTTSDDSRHEMMQRLSSLVDTTEKESVEDTVMRFAHDKGINSQVAQQMINTLKAQGYDYVTYEQLDNQYKQLQSRYDDLSDFNNNQQLQQEFIGGITGGATVPSTNTDKYNPMQQGSVQPYSTLTSSPVGSTSVNPSPISNTPIPNQAIDSSSIASQPIAEPTSIGNEPTESPTISEPSIESEPIQESSIESNSIHESSTENEPLNTQDIQSPTKANHSIESQRTQAIEAYTKHQELMKKEDSSTPLMDNLTISEEARRLFNQSDNLHQ